MSFLDKKLARIGFVYNGFIDWNSIGEFTNAVAEPLKLPLADSWTSVGKNSLRIICKDFFAETQVELSHAKYEVQNQRLILVLNDFQSRLDEREKTKSKRQKKAFKP